MDNKSKEQYGIDIKKEEKCYPASNVMLEMIQKEFEYEVDRSRSLEARSGIFLSFVGALIVFLPGSLDINKLLNIEVRTVTQAFPSIITIITLVTSLVTLILSSIYFTRVLITHQYKRLSTRAFTEENSIYSEDRVCVSIMLDYKLIVDNNCKVNDKKVKLYNKGIYLAVASLILTAIFFILSIFVT